MMTSKEIRKQFLNFFKSKDHTIVPSAPAVPQDDPTLMFTNAGMNQFKDVFLGHGSRKYTRAADTQKCIRVSGKHNDLEEVGRDGYHHTFFEMLGNWSFGDYYKKEAMTWAWELLTQVFKLDKERLYITVYKTDDQAMELWKGISGFGEDRILRFDEKDNFWEMGEVGPCGPCSEIHYDRTPDKSGAKLVNADHEDVIEIWNLVFIQHNRKQDGSLEDLPAKHIDTGMGFERLTSIIQNTKTNYDTDIFLPILNKVAQLSGVPYQQGPEGTPHRVIADHIRMITFSIADGALPSNVGRGYVVRRVLRRAARFGRMIGLDDAFLYKLLETLCELYGETFPELPGQLDFIRQVIKSEESSFKKNLDRGILLFDEFAKDLKKGGIISGVDAFKLYDTYGFPVDMTNQMAEERGFTIDMKAYQTELEAAKERSRETVGTVTADWVILKESDNAPFLGYDHTETEVEIARYRPTGEEDEEQRDIYQVMLTQTPFYAESGGQVGDCGTINAESFTLRVLDTQKIDGQNVSLAVIISGEISGGEAQAQVDSTKRDRTKKNHSATHLMHQALKDVLGDHVQQKGSMVSPELYRFDFSHFEGMTAEQIRLVETKVNEKIQANYQLVTEVLPIEEAKAKGAQALFGEKYGDKVRVVSMGDYSMELCGGTHVKATGDIGLFKILSEGSISAGIRRIEGVTGMGAFNYINQQEDLVKDISAALKCPAEETPERVSSLQEKYKALVKEKDQLRDKLLTYNADEMIQSAETYSNEIYNNIKIICKLIEGTSAEALKNLAHCLRPKMGSAVVVLATEAKGKANVVVAVSDDLVDRGIKSGAIINPVARIVGGGGGGHPRLAQAGGKDPSKLAEAIQAAPGIVKEQLG
ncbi:MAG: alanine--tRNA ligase [Spirochaetaceae bacterium]|nr:alanine--tRNA ligase [Spirochaetaceae bacterium]